MKDMIIIDTNLIISALIKRSYVLFKILDLHLKGIEILTPDYTLEEIKEHKDEILKASKLSEKDFDFIIDVLFRVIKVVKRDVYKDAEKLAKEIAKEFDIDDFPFIALSLKLSIPIWTNDRKMIEYGIKTGKYLALDSESLEDLLKGASIDEVKQRLIKKYL